MVCSWHFREMESYNMGSCVTDFTHSGCFHASSMWWHVLVFHSFIHFYCWIISHYMNKLHFYPFRWWIFGLFPSFFLAIMNSATVNIHVQVLEWRYVFVCLAYTPRSGISGPCGDSIRNYQTVSRVAAPLILPSSSSAVVVIWLLNYTHPRGVKSYLNVVLICISCMTMHSFSDILHELSCLWG